MIKGTGGYPWTDGGEVHLNGMITSMEIRKVENTQILIWVHHHIFNRSQSEIDNIRVKYGDTWADAHGGSGGQAHIFEVNPEAKIVIVQGRSEKRYSTI